MSLAKLRLMNEMELMMMKQDFCDFEAVFALYTISHCSDMMFDEIAECDLPSNLRDGYRAVRSSISSLVDSIKRYRDEKIDTFLSSCDE